MTNLVSVSVDGENRAIEALVGVSKDAERAQQTALRSAGRRARSLVARAMVGELGVPLKTFRERIQYFARRAKKTGERRAVVWVGLQRRPRATEDRRIAAAIQRQTPGAFWATFKEGRKLVQRIAGKLRPAELELEEPAKRHLVAEATQAMRERYSDVLARDFNKRVERRARRARR